MGGRALSSMTGFGRGTSTLGGRVWTWELRSVNARGLDLRVKLPQGWEAWEQQFRQTISARFARGAVQAQLIASTQLSGTPSLNTDLLEQLLGLATKLAARIPGAPAATGRGAACPTRHSARRRGIRPCTRQRHRHDRQPGPCLSG